MDCSHLVGPRVNSIVKRKLILIFAIGISVLLSVNSARKIMAFRSTSFEVRDAEKRLEKLAKENEALKQELEYKKGDKFAEEQIRNKLGLAKQGETVVVVPKEGEDGEVETEKKKTRKSNFNKWMDLFFEN